MNKPDTTKTERVERLLVETGNIEQVYVHHQANLAGHRDCWLICIDFGWGTTIVARADYPHHAAGVAYALAGALDCDLTLDDDITAALEDRPVGVVSEGDPNAS